MPSPRQVVLVRGQMGEPYNLVGLPRAASDASRRCAAAGSALGVSRQQARARPRLLQCVISVSVSCQVIQPGSECCVSHPVPGSPWQVQQAACRRRAALRRLHRLPQPSLPLQVLKALEPPMTFLGAGVWRLDSCAEVGAAWGQH